MYSPDKIEEKHPIYKKQRKDAAVVLQDYNFDDNFFNHIFDDNLMINFWLVLAV